MSQLILPVGYKQLPNTPNLWGSRGMNSEEEDLAEKLLDGKSKRVAEFCMTRTELEQILSPGLSLWVNQNPAPMHHDLIGARLDQETDVAMFMVQHESLPEVKSLKDAPRIYLGKRDMTFEEKKARLMEALHAHTNAGFDED